MNLTIDVENSAGVKQGPGPIASATSWEQVRNLDRLGSFSFEMPASDPRAALLTDRAVVRAYDGTTETGAGEVDKVEVSVGDPTMLRVSGLDLGAELMTQDIIHLPLSETGEARTIKAQVLSVDASSGAFVADPAPHDCVEMYDNNPATGYYYSVPGAMPYRRVMYVGAAQPFNSIRFVIGGATGWAGGGAALGVNYFNGTAWVGATVTVDTTRTTETLMQSGTVTWNMPSDQQPNPENGLTAYWVRFEPGWASVRTIYEAFTYPSQVPTAGALGLIAATLPAGWSLDTVTGYATTLKADVYGLIECESTVEALTKLGELTGEHWCIGAGRKVIWRRKDTPASGIRAISGGDSTALEGNPNVCRIKSLRQTRETYDCAAIIYPYGAGLGDGRLDLRYCTKTPPAGFQAFASNGHTYLMHNAASAIWPGWKAAAFKDIGPQTSDRRAREAAANALLDAAVVWLARHIQANVAYELEVVGLSKAIWPGQTIRVVHHEWVDGYHALGIDADLIVLSATTRLDERGVRTTGLTVSTIDAWPISDVEMLARLAQQGATMGRYPQPVEIGGVNSRDFAFKGLALSAGGLMKV